MATFGMDDYIIRLVVPAFNREELLLLLRENIANPLSWSSLVLSDAAQVTYRIRKYVLNGDSKEAWRLKDSYKDTFALEAISAAIIAQIAITMPGLPDFGNVHWTATAFAYISLVSGLLSTFYSFFVQQILSDLHSPEDVREWLTSPRNNLDDRLINTIRPQCRSQRAAENVGDRGDRIPSLTAAATLIAPSRLLSLSLGSLFIALGIYLGSVYTAKLGTLGGSNANLAVLLCFIIFSILSILQVHLPINSKRMEQISVPLMSNEAQDLRLRELGDSMHNTGLTTAIAPSESSETRDTIREALQMSIRAHEESLKAQQAFLKLLDRNLS